jgi:RNA polymerase sigma-70 factor (ECF subfamily)
MSTDTHAERWRRLIALLEPFHEQAQATARRLCRSPADGDDLYQETVLRAWDKLHTLRDASRFRSWFYAILLSRHRSRHRRSFWRRFLPLEEALPAGDGPAGADGAEWDEERFRADRATRALATLPDVQREAVVLFEIDGYSLEEVAAMQRASLAAVKSRLSRGRERLRRFYERQGGESTRSSTTEPVDAIAGTVERSESHAHRRERWVAVPAARWSGKEPAHE